MGPADETWEEPTLLGCVKGIGKSQTRRLLESEVP